MVDPNWGGGKFGSYPGFAGPVGTVMLAGALPGLGYRQFWKGGKDLLSMSRQLSPQQLLRQMQRRLPSREPTGLRPLGSVRPRRDWARPLLRPLKSRDVRADDLTLGYKPQHWWPRWKGEPYNPKLTPQDLDRIMRVRMEPLR